MFGRVEKDPCDPAIGRYALIIRYPKGLVEDVLIKVLIRYPKGLVKDVLIKVGDFVFPMDFVVLDTKQAPGTEPQIPVILGRPFLVTSNALINWKNGVLQISFGTMTVQVNIFNVRKQPPDKDDGVFEVNYIHELAENHMLQLNFKDPLEAFLAHFGTDFDIDGHIENVNACCAQPLLWIAPSGNPSMKF